MMAPWMKGSLLLAATLAAGIVIGVWYERSHHGASFAIGVDNGAIMSGLHATLELDSAQLAAISATMRHHQLLVDSAWGTLRPQVSATVDSLHAEIMSLLTPEQRERFARMAAGIHKHSHR